MIDKALIEEWYNAARSEFRQILDEYKKSNCKFEAFESGNHYSLISVRIDGECHLSISFRSGYGRGFFDYVGTAEFPSTVFLGIVTMVNGEIEKRWKFLEDYRAEQKKATEEMDSILRKQISSWRLLGKDVKPP